MGSSTDVGVVDLGIEYDFGRRHGVVVGEEELCLELSVFVAGSGWAWMEVDVPWSSMKKCL